MTFEEWWDSKIEIGTPDTFRGWEESCRQAWKAAESSQGLTVLKTMLEIFDIMGNPAQFRAALAAAVAKREVLNT